VLRRLDDEPLAVADKVTEHLTGCARCTARQERIAGDTEFAARLLNVHQPVPETDLAWARVQRELLRQHEGLDRQDRQASNPRRGLPSPVGRHRRRAPRVSLRAAAVIGVLGILVAATAAAASLTTIFDPTHVAPVTLSENDMQAITSFIGLGDNRVLGGFATPSGSSTARFGTIRWASSAAAHPVPTLSDASAEAGFPVVLPTHLPAGVGGVHQYVVQPRVRATVTFNSTAGSVAGSSVTLDAGPAVFAAYAGVSGDLPTLLIATMPRPTAVSAGASMSRIEAYVLGQPGIPPALAEEVRLLGDLRTTLPVPVPQGVAVHSVQIGGWPGVLLADPSNSVAGAVWEDGRGMLHIVAGILDSQDVLNVAGQLG
jgi:hypothetical protein